MFVGLPGIEAEEDFEEDSHRPLMNGAENEDESESNYSIQEGNPVTHVQAISFYQACCLPGVIPVRTVRVSSAQLLRYYCWTVTLPGLKHLEVFSFSLRLYFRSVCSEEYV